MGKTVTLEQLYQEMADLTRPECSGSCALPHSCCHARHCADTIQWAQERWGVTLVPTGHPTLPLMGEGGCVAAPHLRPICTVHTCDIASMGFKRLPQPDPQWTRQYFRLRGRIDRAEWRRMQKQDDSLG